MNAASQRRLTPWLGGIAIGLVALFGVFLSGVGSGVRWDPPPPPAPLPVANHAVAAPPPTPLDRYAVVWQRPLFAPDRRPAPVAATAGGVRLGDLELTGIILTPGLRMALLRDKSADPKSGASPDVRVREGASLPGGQGTLVSLSPRSAVFATGGGRTSLELPVTAPPALDKAGSNDSSNPNNPNNPNNPAAQAQPNPELPPGAMTIVQPQPPTPGVGAIDRSRLEALKAAIQKRRAEQQQQHNAPARDR